MKMTKSKLIRGSLAAAALALTLGAALPAFAAPSFTGVTTFSKTELAQAKKACGGLSNVVWTTGTSSIYHPSTSGWFGTTEHGFYLCEKAAVQVGLHS